MKLKNMKILNVLLVGLVIGIGSVTLSISEEIDPINDPKHGPSNEILIDQNQEQYDFNFTFYGDRWCAQSFQPTTQKLSKVELLLCKYSSQEHDQQSSTIINQDDSEISAPGIIVSIRSRLNGPDLTHIFVPRAELPEEISWVEFDFPDISTEFSSTKGYYIVTRSADKNNSNQYIWGCGIQTPYLNGVLLYSTNAGQSWIEEPDLDFCFRTYGSSTGSNYTLTSKYDYIKSYPVGGGIFPIYIEVNEGFSGEVTLSIDADIHLHAQLDTTTLTNESRVAELTIRPDTNIEIITHTIQVISTQGEQTQSISLDVEIMNTTIGEPSSYIIQKRDTFIDWLESEHPEYGDLSNQEWFAYATYPGIMVVEHWTFLSGEWEFRVCCHITIPPYNWSKMCLRELGNVDATIAAHCEYDDTIYEIPIEEYPTFYGY